MPNPNYATWTKAPALPGGAQTLTIKATVISCPVTLIGQWQDEIRRWAPELRILVNHGSSKDRNNLNRGKLDASLRDYDVIICSPNTRLSGDSLLVHRELRFHRLIVDEAHATRGATERFLRESALVDPPPSGNTYSRRTFTPRFDSCWLVRGSVPYVNLTPSMRRSVHTGNRHALHDGPRPDEDRCAGPWVLERQAGDLRRPDAAT